ncbi:hypothetical protein SAMN05444422_105112 [Halobiforma haloterrestris]|uniref:Uncharacterized protein n=1 Tax=Natronobacterium haloterrestre TaxID=148448 RepID=A0A1I1GZL1_NATHA|nr:hypothetical protein [Halobiforma haloterrestris]SFC17094.1 hypothetical protein SAMN05444422_105112 [Halobiforma haloterrestris]
MPLASLVARFRSHPIATTLELGSVVVCLALFVTTFALLLSGAPATGAAGARTGTAETAWLAVVGVGAVFVLFWTALVPLYERLVY